MQISSSKLHNYFSFLVAIIYAGVIAFYLPLDGFKDRANYLEYADNAIIYLVRYLSEGVMSFLTNEPFFLLFNNILRLLFEAETVLQIFIFLPAFLFSYTILKIDRKNIVWLLLFLLLPQVLKNNVMQLRQGFAVAVFVFAWFSLTGKTKWFIFLLTPSIHSSMFIVVSLLIFINILKSLHLSIGVRNLGVILFGIVASVSLLYLAAALGARQGVQYQNESLSISGNAFLYWSIVLGIFLVQKRIFLEKHSFAIANLIFYLCLYFTFPLSARIFESAMIFVLLAGLDLHGNYKISYIGLFLFYFIFQYYLKLGQPMLGMGV